MDTHISKYVRLAEVLKSATAIKHDIDNTPTDEALANLRVACERVFDPVREHFGVPIHISSGYRSPELNKAIGGAKDSQHVYGLALDIDADTFGRVTNLQIFEFIKKKGSR